MCMGCVLMCVGACVCMCVSAWLGFAETQNPNKSNQELTWVVEQ